VTRRLNWIDDEAAQWAIDRARKTIARAGEDSPGKLWDAYFHLGVSLIHQRGADDEIRDALQRAARYAVIAFERRRPAKTHTTPHDFAHALGLIAAFGDADLQHRASGIERARWFHPEEGLWRLQADALEQLQSWLGRSFDRAHAEAVVERCGAINAPRHAVRVDAPLVTALIAIELHDEQRLQHAVRTIVDEHEFQALHGDLQFSSEGLIAPLPLALARLAGTVGMVPGVSSPYVPSQLL